MSRILAIAAVAVFLALGASFKCVAADFKYTPISGVTQSVNDLGKNIAQEQAKVVTPGGNEYAPGYSAVDQTNFEASGKLTKIVANVTDSPVFKNGVIAIQNLPAVTQSKIFNAYATPLWPTWAMNGRIDSSGTTDAGYAVESEIATAIAGAVKTAVAVEDLGHQIRAAQRDNITSGGNEYAPGFSAVDQTNFEASGKLTKIVAALTGSDTFKLDIAAFKTLTEGAQAKALDKMSVPIWPTWAMNGRIDSTGTTDAGYAVESEIISAMVKAIKAAL